MILEVNEITKTFPGPNKTKIIANDQLSFQIGEGEIFGLLGHNGAGKTTIVNQILGLVTPNEGDITLLGESVLQSPIRARSICSVQPQSQVPLGFLTPKQAVTLMGKMRAGKKFDPKRMEWLFEMLDMGEWINKEGQKLSGGARRLTAFCMAVISPGKLIVLDEPTNDVDPVRRRYLWQVVRELSKDGTSVLLVTHNIVEAEKVIDRMAILDKGRLLVQGKPTEIKNAIRKLMRLEMHLTTECADVNLPDWVHQSHQKGSRLVYSIDPTSAPLAIQWASEQVDKGLILDYSLSPTTIEDVYIELTSRREQV